ncbi:MAG: 4a-hydroxytetrahydrobiopterin dehydratase [Sandaracinaceae bacterium]|nr:4a-hydroxytetrahydrobiopterin dehydratase [Sandaracinaceae bacterium]
MTEPLEEDALNLALAALDGWKHEGHALKKRFVFRDFREAMMFMVRLSYEAEALSHHPEIHNVYKTVDLALTTHDAGNRVTAKDVELAAAIESFL